MARLNYIMGSNILFITATSAAYGKATDVHFSNLLGLYRSREISGEEKKKKGA